MSTKNLANLRKRYTPATPQQLRAWAKLWRTMHAGGTPKQRADAEEQAARNERRAR